MLPKHVRYQTALHPVVPVSLACPAGDFLSIHPFQQFVNPQNEFFCGFFDSFWAFFGKSPQMPVFSAFFRFPLPVIRGVFGSYPPAKPSARPCRSAKRRFRTWTKPSPSAALPRRATCSATGRPSGILTALLCQRNRLSTSLSTSALAAYGVLIHALAGLRAEKRFGANCSTPQALIDVIRLDDKEL